MILIINFVLNSPTYCKKNKNIAQNQDEFGRRIFLEIALLIESVTIH